MLVEQVSALERWSLPSTRWREAGVPVSLSGPAVNGAAVLGRPGIQLSTLQRSPALAADMPACVEGLQPHSDLANTVTTECKYRS